MKIRKMEAAIQNTKPRVAVYCRVSTRRVEQEDSLELQQAAYTRYILSNPGWAFAGVYADTRSGLNAGKLDGFRRMVADACAGKIDLILCKSLSRFSRNIVECQRHVQLLRAKNVVVVFEKEHIRTDDPASSLIFSLMCAIAQDESRSISENMKTANRHRVEAGIYTPRKNQMLGYDVEMGHFVPNGDAWIIRHIFIRYAQGAGIMEICRELDRQGAQRKYSRRGFSPSVIQRILRNESYVGDKHLQKEAPRNFLTKRPDPSVPYATNYLIGDHTPIVSPDLWASVQARLDRQARERSEGLRRRGTSHPLYGRIRCGCCGQLYMRRTFKTRTVPPYRKVWCCKGKTYGSGCKNPNIREEILLREMSAIGTEKAVIDSQGQVVPVNIP